MVILICNNFTKKPRTPSLSWSNIIITHRSRVPWNPTVGEAASNGNAPQGKGKFKFHHYSERIKDFQNSGVWKELQAHKPN